MRVSWYVICYMFITFVCVEFIRWLHNENMFAVAQKEWTYIYDRQGIEIHCLKKLDRVMSLDFLPYHFLLVGGHQSGW
jgi:U3 small nucleolar RNA-associated protein 7